jgi:tRNA threonylcarbamoyladenosine biosynthesis protein TsaB
MDYILNIHTTTETAIVCLSKENEVISSLSNDNSKDHAKFLHLAIQKILQESDIHISELKGVSVTNGPGSYTGIRVGLATAKGFCFSLKIPLITLNTLEVLAFSAIESIDSKTASYCPMIDARRMEVFTALYDGDLQLLNPPSAIVLDENSFLKDSALKPIYFFGSGSKKFEELIGKKEQFLFIEQEIDVNSFSKLAYKKFRDGDFQNAAFAEPFYLKEFYSGA